MTIRDQQVLPSVVVVIEEAVAETDERYCRGRDADLVADIREDPRPIIVKDDIVVVGEGGIDQIQVTVVLVIAGSDAHVGYLAAITIQGIAA